MTLLWPGRFRAPWIIRGAVRTPCGDGLMKRLKDLCFAKNPAHAQPVEVRPQKSADASECDANVLGCQFAE